MLEQPPEKSAMEVAAEAAADAKKEVPPSNLAHGCFRLIIWCSPSFVIALIFASIFMLEANSASLSDIAIFFIIGTLSIAATYGIGYFDGLLSRKTFAPLDSERRNKLIMHAVVFTGWQFFIVPAITILAIGACFAIYASA